MARIAPKDYIGTRVRLYRLSDARIFSGWIRSFFGNQVGIDLDAKVPVEINDLFRIEAHGRRSSVQFEASLLAVEAFDIAASGVVEVIKGSNARIIEAHTVSVTVCIQGQMRYTPSTQTFRVRIANVEVSLTRDSQHADGILVDASEGGLAAVCPVQPPVGAEVDFKAQTSLGLVCGKAVVRNVRPSAERPGFFRIGLEIVRLGRLDLPRWHRFVQEA